MLGQELGGIEHAIVRLEVLGSVGGQGKVGIGEGQVGKDIAEPQGATAGQDYGFGVMIDGDIVD